MKRFLACAAAIALAAAAVAAPAVRWGTGSCDGAKGPVGPALALPATKAQAPSPTGGRLWAPSSTSPGVWFLLEGRKQLGTYDPAQGGYRPLRGDRTFGPACDPPEPLPDQATHNTARRRDCPCGTKCPKGEPCPCADRCDCAEPKPDPAAAKAALAELEADVAELGPAPREVQNFGNDWHAGLRERYTLSGEEVTPAEGLEAIGIAADIPDDAGLPTCTIIGAEVDRQRVLQDFRARPALAAGKVKVQAIGPEHWAAAGFKPNAPVVLSFAQPNSAEPEASRMKEDGYAPDIAERAEKTLTEMGKLRTIDPNFDPDKTPDLSKPKKGKAAGDDNSGLYVAGGLLALAAAAAATTRKPK
jgi:hypothetical protein